MKTNHRLGTLLALLLLAGCAGIPAQGVEVSPTRAADADISATQNSLSPYNRRQMTPLPGGALPQETGPQPPRF